MGLKREGIESAKSVFYKEGVLLFKRVRSLYEMLV
jgi:hypothetical protein